jgi:hypothetical protein
MNIKRSARASAIWAQKVLRGIRISSAARTSCKLITVGCWSEFCIFIQRRAQLCACALDDFVCGAWPAAERVAIASAAGALLKNAPLYCIPRLSTAPVPYGSFADYLISGACGGSKLNLHSLECANLGGNSPPTGLFCCARI